MAMSDDTRRQPARVAECRGAAESWWSWQADLGVIEIVDHDAARDLLSRPEDLGAHLFGFIVGLVEANASVCPELIHELRRAIDGGLLDLDGDAHREIRALLGRAFTPRATTALRPFIEGEARRLARELNPGDDIMANFARELPALALCELTGIPDEDRDQFMEWADLIESVHSVVAALTMSRSRSEQVAAAMVAMDDYARTLIARRRAEPADDVVTRIATDPAGIDDATRALLIRALIFAGNDTTRNMIGLALLVLAEHPGTWERMAAEPDHVVAVVDELLRFASPARAAVRRVRRPFTYRDRTFDTGQIVVVSLWSANRDRAAWGADVDRFDPERVATCPHLSFGHGSHHCVGASLARAELQVALAALAGELTDLAVIGEAPLRPPGGIDGPISLHLNFRRRRDDVGHA